MKSLWQSIVYNETSTNIECNCVTLIFLDLYNHTDTVFVLVLYSQVSLTLGSKSRL